MAGLQIYREVIRIVRTLPLSKQIQKKIKYNVKELIIFRQYTPEEPKHTKFISLLIINYINIFSIFFY